MAVRKIRTGNDPILKKKCKTVPEVDDKARQQLDDYPSQCRQRSCFGCKSGRHIKKNDRY